MVLMLREKFGWSLQKYTIYSSLTGVNGVIGGVFGIMVLHMWLKVPETILLLIGFISGLDQALVYALANKDWEIYFGNSVAVEVINDLTMIKYVNFRRVR